MRTTPAGWATWCGPCRKGLPLVQKFADWAKDKDDVVVYAVNVWERGEDEAAIIEKIDAFWTKEKFTMPTLMSFALIHCKPEFLLLDSFELSVLGTALSNLVMFNSLSRLSL